MKYLGRIVFLVAVIMVASYVPNSSAQFFMTGNPLVGEKSPDFTLDTTSGEKVNMTKFRDKHSAIIFFWATWCPHCREQLKVLNNESANMLKKNIKIILVDIGEGAKQVQAHLKREKISLNVFLDQDQAIAETYAIIGVPTFFFINKSGVITAVEHTIPDNYEEILSK